MMRRECEIMNFCLKDVLTQYKISKFSFKLMKIMSVFLAIKGD